MPATKQSTLQIVLTDSSKQPFKVGTIAVPIDQQRKWGSGRLCNSLVITHQWWNLNPGQPDFIIPTAFCYHYSYSSANYTVTQQEHGENKSLCGSLGMFPRSGSIQAESWERLGQMERVGKEVPQRGDGTGHGQAVPKRMAHQGKSGIAGPPGLSAEGPCLLECAAQERKGNTWNDLGFEASWVRTAIREQRAFRLWISPPPTAAQEAPEQGGPQLEEGKSLVLAGQGPASQSLWDFLVSEYGFPFSTKGPLTPSFQPCTLLYPTGV